MYPIGGPVWFYASGTPPGMVEGPRRRRSHFAGMANGPGEMMNGPFARQGPFGPPAGAMMDPRREFQGMPAGPMMAAPAAPRRGFFMPNMPFDNQLTATARWQQGYGAAIEDVQGAGRLARFAQREPKRKQSRPRTSSSDEDVESSFTEDAYEKYRKHKTKHEKYSRMLAAGPEGDREERRRHHETRVSRYSERSESEPPRSRRHTRRTRREEEPRDFLPFRASSRRSRREEEPRERTRDMREAILRHRQEDEDARQAWMAHTRRRDGFAAEDELERDVGRRRVVVEEEPGTWHLPFVLA